MSFPEESAVKVNLETTLDATLEVTDTASELQRLIQINTRKRERSLTWLAISMCVLGAIFYCYEYYLRVAPSVMASELKLAFNLSDAAFGNLFACYYYAYTPMQIPVGLLLDRFGPRKVLTLACVLCALGTYWFATTDTLRYAQLGRFIVGFGSAFAYVGVLKITDMWLPKKYFALMVGISTALGMIGAMTGELTMAYMVGQMGWQATLSWSVIAGVFLSILLALILKDSGRPANAINTRIANKASDTLKNIEREGLHNTLPLEDSGKVKSITVMKGLGKIILTPAMWMNGIIGCLTYLPITVFAELWAVPYLQTLGFSRTLAAWGSSMIFLGFAVGGPVWGYVSDHLNSRKVPLIFGSLLSALFLLACILWPNPSAFWVFTLLFLCSVAASAQVLVFAIGNDITCSSVTATAVAFTNMLVMLGGAFLPQLIGQILDSTLNINAISNLGSIGTENYRSALLIIPFGLILAGVLSVCLKESYKNNH